MATVLVALTARARTGGTLTSLAVRARALTFDWIACPCPRHATEAEELLAGCRTAVAGDGLAMLGVGCLYVVALAGRGRRARGVEQAWTVTSLASSDRDLAAIAPKLRPPVVAWALDGVLPIHPTPPPIDAAVLTHARPNARPSGRA